MRKHHKCYLDIEYIFAVEKKKWKKIFISEFFSLEFGQNLWKLQTSKHFYYNVCFLSRFYCMAFSESCESLVLFLCIEACIIFEIRYIYK